MEYRKLFSPEIGKILSVSVSVSAIMVAQIVLSVTETIIVARINLQVLAGVTYAIGMFLIVFLFSLGVVTAITPIAAFARGAGDNSAVKTIGQQGLWVGLSFSGPGVILLLGLAYFSPLLLGINEQALSARDYLIGAAIGLPAWVSYVAARSFAVATEKLRVTTIVMVSAVPIHAIITWVFVFGGWGIDPMGAFGAGLAYSLTAYIMLIMLVVLASYCDSGDVGKIFLPPFRYDKTVYSNIVKLGLPFAWRIILREGVLPVSAIVLAPYGAASLAAHAVANRIVELSSVFSFGLSNAANLHVSHALGSKNISLASSFGWKTINLAVIICILLSIFLLLASDPITFFMLGSEISSDSEAFKLVSLLLIFAAALQFLEGVQTAAGGALNGLQDAKAPLVISLIGSWGIGLPIGALLASHMDNSVVGLWLGLGIGSAFTTGLYLLRFKFAIKNLNKKYLILE